MIRFHAISRLDGGVIDGIHLLWSPPFPAGHSLDGFTIYRRDARGDKKDTHCFDVDVRMLGDVRSRGVLWSPDATLWADAKDPVDPLHTTWTYRLELPGGTAPSQSPRQALGPRSPAMPTEPWSPARFSRERP